MTTPLSFYDELYLRDNGWVDISQYVRQSGNAIERGYESENSKPRPGSYQGRFNDPDGRWNRRNPLGAYYGQLGKNMPYRKGIIMLVDDFARTETNTWGSVGNVAGDTWTNGTSTGGTVSATDWTVSGGTARHSLPAAGAYRVSELSKADRPFVDSEVLLSDITVPTNNVTGTGALASEVWFRTQDVSNFASVSLAYQIDETLLVGMYERTAGVNRMLLGYTVIPGLSLASTVNYHLRAGIEGSVLRAKVWPAGDPEPRDWQVWASRATIRDGYGAIASYVFTGNTNAKPLVFQYGRAEWRIPLGAWEIPSFGKRSDDASGRSKYVEVRAGGVTQRLGQGDQPSLSPMTLQRSSSTGWATVGTLTSVESVGSYNTVKATDADVADDAAGYRYVIFGKDGERKEDTLFTLTGFSSSGGFTTCTFAPDALEPVEAGDVFSGHRVLTAADAAVALWPCEDRSDSTSIASALPGGEPMTIRYATPSFASEDRIRGSDPVLKFHDAEITASVPTYFSTATSLVFVTSFPDVDEAATGQDLLQFFTADGDGWSYDVQYQSTGNGSLALLVFNKAGTQVFSNSTDFSLRGDAAQVTLVFRQSTPTVVTYQAFVINADETVLTSTGPHTITGINTFGRIHRIAGNPGGGYDDVGFGQLMILPTAMSSNLNLFDDFTGHARDSAQLRLQRNCEQQGIPFSYRSDRDIITSRMGTQENATFLDRIEDCADVDMGFLYEPKSALGIEYCSRGALSNQEPFLVLSMANREVQPDWAPDDDDRYLRNYIKVSRRGGSSFIAEETDGPLSTADYPDGAGRYTGGGGTINVNSDAALVGQAWWRLHLGTVDEDRIVKLTVKPRGSISLERLASVNIGYRIVITDVQGVDVYDDIDLLVLGYTLDPNKFSPTFTFNCVPASPYRILTCDDDEYGWYGDTDSVLDEDLTTTETDLTVRSESGHWLWDGTDAPFNITVGGEVMTVTAVSGTSSPQTFTVTRSVNGVVKEHDTGAAVEIARPVYYGL